MLERFDHGKIRVVQVGVFADEGNGYGLEQVVLTACERLPGVPCLGALLRE